MSGLRPAPALAITSPPADKTERLTGGGGGRGTYTKMALLTFRAPRPGQSLILFFAYGLACKYAGNRCRGALKKIRGEFVVCGGGEVPGRKKAVGSGIRGTGPGCRDT